MNYKNVNGRRLVCGHVFKRCEIKPGQQWAQADGTDRVVTVHSNDNGNILYTDCTSARTYENDWFNFQCRYCLISDE